MIKKLCLFSTSFAFNRQVVLNYLEKIFSEDTEIFLFTPKKHQEHYSSKRAKIVKTNCNKYTSFFGLRKFCKQNKIDRIMNLGCLPQEGFVMAFASLFTKTDFVGHVLENPIDSFRIRFNKSGIKAFLAGIFLYPFTFFPKKVFICSEDILRLFKRYSFFTRKKISRLPVTVNTDFFSPKTKTRKKINLPLKQKIILFVGRIEYLKGADIIFNLAERNKDWNFILIGKNNTNFLFNKLPNIKIIDSISSEELLDYYNSADLCFLPSRIESFGIVPREAMACGIPTIVSDITALRTIRPAIKVPLDTNKIEEKIKIFFRLSKKEKKSLSANSREWVIKDSGDNTWKQAYIDKILN